MEKLNLIIDIYTDTSNGIVKLSTRLILYKPFPISSFKESHRDFT